MKATRAAIVDLTSQLQTKMSDMIQEQPKACTILENAAAPTLVDSSKLKGAARLD